FLNEVRLGAIRGGSRAPLLADPRFQAAAARHGLGEADVAGVYLFGDELPREVRPLLEELGVEPEGLEVAAFRLDLRDGWRAGASLKVRDAASATRLAEFAETQRHAYLRQVFVQMLGVGAFLEGSRFEAEGDEVRLSSVVADADLRGLLERLDAIVPILLSQPTLTEGALQP
ncbi:MAG: hypothetical protein OEY14_18870, partial [Myxococcales bacterium]|nr:hypothetical protein [Myxococcales bacterium]